MDDNCAMKLSIRPKRAFAVVVAAHAARDSLSGFHRRALASVYGVFCLATLAKAWADLSEIGLLNEMIVGTPFDVNTAPNWVAAVFRLVIYVVFSIVVTIFVLRPEVLSSKGNG